MSLQKLQNVSMTPAQGQEFVKKLATDDHFRKELESDPIRAFASIHIHVPAGALSAKDIKLPPKEGLAHALSKVQAGHAWQVPGSETEIDAHYAFFAFFIFFLAHPSHGGDHKK
jgi:putative modified peptide